MNRIVKRLGAAFQSRIGSVHFLLMLRKTEEGPSLKHLDAISCVFEFAITRVLRLYTHHLDELAARADTWIHGHMHASLDYRLGGCRALSNPLGYKNRVGQAENYAFIAGFVVGIC